MSCTLTNGYYYYVYTVMTKKNVSFVIYPIVSLLDYEAAEKAQCLDLTRGTIYFRRPQNF